MPCIDPTDVKLEKDGHRLTLRTPFWSVMHDLERGGVPVDVRFVHGAEGNVLRGPMATWVDGLSDAAGSQAAVRARRASYGVELAFEGSMADERGKAANLTFRSCYHYTPYWVRREVQIRLPRAVRAHRVCPLSARFEDRFTHWSAAHDPQTKRGRAERIIGPHYDQDDGPVPSRAGVFFHDPLPPGWMSLYRPGGEGLQIAPAGDLTAWDAPAGVAGQGNFRLAYEDEAVGMHWDALSATRATHLPRSLAFAAFIALANLPAIRPAPLRTVMVGNPPFPADDILRAWAESGVQLIVIMEGASWGSIRASGGPTSAEIAGWGHGTDRFWRTGLYPCYHDERDMRDLNRIIRSTHRFGMRIIPYTCPTELHPEVPAFSKNARKWHQAAVPNGGVIYHAAGKSAGGCYGALMCPDSAGWQDFYFNYVKTLLTSHAFDGAYVDNVWKATCYNREHGPTHHSGLDGLWDVMGKVRKLLGRDKLMVIHNGESHFLASSNNLADMIVTLEGVAWLKKFRYDLAAISHALRAFPACGVSMVPCSTWYRVPPPLPKQTGLRDGIAKGLLLGSIPYSYAWWEMGWGYEDGRDTIRDRRGLYEAFRRLKSLSLEGLRFDDCFTNVVRTNHRGVMGARYYGAGRGVILIANVSGRDRHNIRWRCAGASGTIGRLLADEYRFVEA